MAHLIRSISGTNREPIYGLWYVCEICPDDPEVPGETVHLQRVVDAVDQIPGMSLEEFWANYAGGLLENLMREANES